MKLILKLAGLCLFAALLAVPAGLILLAIEDTPRISGHFELTYDNIKRARQLIKENRPAHFYSRQKKTIRLAENDINLLLSYGASRVIDLPSLLLKVRLENGHAEGVMTYPLPKNFLGRYINLSVTFSEKNPGISPAHVRIGQIVIPKEIAKPVITFFHKTLLKNTDYAKIFAYAKNIDQIILKPDLLIVHYFADYRTVASLKETGRQFLMSREQQTRFLAYHNHLAGLTRTHRSAKDALIPLLQGLSAFAAQNAQQSGDPVLENRYLLQVLSLYTIGRRPDPLLDDDLKRQATQMVRTRMTFYGRSDLPKHFLVSAALTVSGGSRFADLIGIAKEIDDADGGSGFSFADLAADKAGIRFGQMAAGSLTRARQFQNRVQHIKNQADIMPSISRLPEGIMELQFEKSYRDLDSAAYQMVNTEIESRLNRCMFYRD